MNEIQDEYREYRKLCRVEDDPGVSGLAQLGRNAIERVRQLERALAERDERISQIERSHAVMQARLRACGQVLVEEIGAVGPEAADKTAERAACVIRQLRDRTEAAERELRAVWEASTVAEVSEFYGIPYVIKSYPSAPLGTELIARPARKGE